MIDVASQDFDDAVSGNTNHQSVIAFAKQRDGTGKCACGSFGWS